MKHSKHLILALSVFAFAGIAGGCSHAQQDHQLDQKVEQQKPVSGPNQLNQEASQLIEKMPDLTPEQRQKLTSLRQSTHTEMDGLREQSLKLRSLLLQEWAKPDFSAKQIKLIEKRIKSVEDKRLSTLFTSFDQANSILGRDYKHRNDVLGQMMEEHHPLRD